jgi:AcrR family transcriptional regulator
VADISLRPLATAVGSSPRVLLFLFGSKAGLVQALLARARRDELALLDRARAGRAGRRDLVAVGAELWGWLAAEEHRGLLNLWVEGYARSLIDPGGPWAGFARATVADWLDVLGEVSGDGAECTLVLAVLRGALLDLLATGDLDRVGAAVERHLQLLRPAPAR